MGWVVLALLALAACSQPSAAGPGSPPASTSTAASASSSASRSSPGEPSFPGTAVSVASTTTTELTVDPGSVTALQPVVLHVRVRGKGAVTPPTGTVTLLDGGRPVASTALTASTGASEDLRVTMHAGSHALTARYAGDKAHKASVSSPLPLVVHQMASTVSVSAKRNPKNAREFRFSARVQTHVVGVHATGTMTFVVGGRGYTFALDSLGHAAFHLVLTAGRTYTVVATYSGSTDISRSSAGTSFTV